MMYFNYTTTVQEIFESFEINHDDRLSNKQVIENGRPILFDFDYPMFDPSYKNVFETNFIRNFYLRQIGVETFGLFKFQLETWLEINMPYFNKLFESELINYDPLENTKLTETNKRTLDRDQTDTKTADKTKDVVVDSTLVKDQNIKGTVDQTGKTTGENDSTGSSSIEGNSDSSKTGTNTNDKTLVKDGTSDQKDFARNLETDTPQNRLQITTGTEGNGVIEYASKISEDSKTKGNNYEDFVSENQKQTDSSDSSETSKVEGSTTNKDKTLLDTANKETNVVNDETKTNSNENVNQKESQNDRNVMSFNSVDEYVSCKVGKVGTQSYASMVLDYRNTLLRIERQMFKEMHQLFMTVY